MKKIKKTKGLQHTDLSRRNFIGIVGAATAAFTIIPNHVMAGKGYLQPSDTVNVAGIGIGSQGGGDIQQLCTSDVPIERRMPTMRPGAAPPGGAPPGGAPPGASPGGAPGAAVADPNATVQMGAAASSQEIKLANVYALCDVDTDYASRIFKGYPKAKVYTDWRQMLEKEPSIDAVVIGTPDHNHAPIAAAFIKEKKHIYVEKPMAKTVYECRRLTELAKEYDVVTQMGNQGHASEGSRMTVEWIQSGVIGNIREVYLSTNRPGWPQGNITRPEGVKIPKTLNYDIWIGPAPYKPYHPDILHFNWRGLWDYGTGAMGDMGAHIFDAPIWALNLGMPSKIQATSSPYSTDYLPQSEWVTYEFPERFTPGIGYMPPVKVTWCDGGLRPPRPGALEAGRAVMDATYIGENGIIMHGSHGAVPQLVPADPDFKGPEPWIPRTGNIFEDWIGAIQSGKKSSNDFAISAKLTEIMLLTNIAVLTQRSNVTLEYDAANMRMTNLDAANDLFHYEYREGWSL